MLYEDYENYPITKKYHAPSVLRMHAPHGTASRGREQSFVYRSALRVCAYGPRGPHHRVVANAADGQSARVRDECALTWGSSNAAVYGGDGSGSWPRCAFSAYCCAAVAAVRGTVGLYRISVSSWKEAIVMIASFHV